MKLDAVEEQVGGFHAHDGAVVGPGGDAEGVGECLAVDDE